MSSRGQYRCMLEWSASPVVQIDYCVVLCSSSLYTSSSELTPTPTPAPAPAEDPHARSVLYVTTRANIPNQSITKRNETKRVRNYYQTRRHETPLSIVIAIASIRARARARAPAQGRTVRTVRTVIQNPDVRPNCLGARVGWFPTKRRGVGGRLGQSQGTHSTHPPTHPTPCPKHPTLTSHLD
jgi:hypothetical protein